MKLFVDAGSMYIINGWINDLLGANLGVRSASTDKNQNFDFLVYTFFMRLFLIFMRKS